MKKIVILAKEQNLIKEVLGIELPNTIYNKYIGGSVYIDSSNGAIYIDKQKIKLSKLLKLAGFNLSPAENSRLMAKWSAYFKSSTIQVSSSLSAIYNLSHACKGTIGNSCMRYKGEFYRVFDDHPDISIAYLTNDDRQLIGRAILWHGVQVHGEKRSINVMDRVYYDTPSTLELFLKYAQKNGYYFKKEQNFSNKKDFISPNGEIESLKLKFNIDLSEAEYLPYLDTFSYYSLEKSRLYNYNAKSANFMLDSTDGVVDGITAIRYICDHCGDPIDEDDLCYSHHHDAALCPECAIWSETLQDFIIEDESIPILDSAGEIIDHAPAYADIENYTQIEHHYYSVIGIENPPDYFYVHIDDAIILDHYVLFFDNITYIKIFDEDIPVVESLFDDIDTFLDYIAEYILEYIGNNSYYKFDDMAWNQKDKIKEFLQDHKDKDLIDLDLFFEEEEKNEEK